MNELETACNHLMFVSGFVHRLLHRRAQHLGLRWTALMVLKDLDVLGTVNQQALADIEQVRKPTMTVLLQQMERDGWISRTPDPNSGCTKLVQLTPKGRAELRSTGAKLRKHLEMSLAGMEPSDISSLTSALTPLVQHWLAIATRSSSRD